MRGTVLVVDDSARPRRALSAELEDAGFEVRQAANGNEAWEIFESTTPSVVVTDLVMPKQDGLRLLEKIRERSDVPVIMFTSKATVASAAAAFKRGADEFLSSTDLEIEELVSLVANASGADAAALSAAEDTGVLNTRIAGKTPEIQRVRERIFGLAPLRSPVIVLGERGSGRDVVIEALHETGASSSGPLLKIDRHTKVSQEELKQARAVYLDGIEDLGEEMQSLWARWIRDGERHQLERWPRVFASTTSMLPMQAHAESPHQELRNLLLRFAVELPPLRKIPSDIPPIADAIVAKLSSSMSRRVRLSASARQFLAEQRWPGNTKQLEQVLERAIAFTRTRQIKRAAIEELLGELEESVDGIRARHRAEEREELLDAIRTTGGNVSRTAEKLGRSRGAVYRMIEKYDITLKRSH